MTITTEEAERLARFHDVSKELYSGNPEDSGLCAMHHTSAAALRSLAAERDALKNRIAELENLVVYLCGKNTDYIIRVALAGNPTVVDAVVARAEAALEEGKKDE